MLKSKALTITICIVILTSGCSGILEDQQSHTPNNNPITLTETEGDITETGGNNSKNNKNISNNGSNASKNPNYTAIFRSAINQLSINTTKISKEGDTLQLNYTGDFTNEARTISELKYITAIFSGVVNRSYHNQSSWGVSRLNVVGISSNGSKVWDFRTEDWWAMNYALGKWDLDSYLNATLDSGHHWNVTAQRPEPGGVNYLIKIRSNIQHQTDIEVASLDKHGAEAFLTYETDHELNSSQYFDEVANVVDVYKNLTLPRSLNRTEGWYAGVLNMEVRNGNDTLEWYRYRIRWAEERVKGEMSREEEAGRLRLSRFLEKDKLRDNPNTDE